MNIKVATINVNGLRAASRTGKSAKNGYGFREWLYGVTPEIAQSMSDAERSSLTQKYDPIVDIVAIQELKAQRSEIDATLDFLGIRSENFYMQNDVLKKGHAGVGIAVLNPALKVTEVRMPFENLPETEKYLTSGRWIEVDVTVKGQNSAENTEFTLISVYIHHADSPTTKRKATKAEVEAGLAKAGGDMLIDRKQSEYTMNNKHYFMALMSERIRELVAGGKEIIVAGDYNIAHYDIDIKNSAGNATKAGFLPEERAWLDLWLANASENAGNSAELKSSLKTYKENPKIEYKAPTKPAGEFKVGGLGLHDVCRELWGGTTEVYSWWTYMGHAFDNDAGWRIDYQMCTSALISSAKSARIDKQPAWEYRWSDHAPVIVEYDLW